MSANLRSAGGGGRLVVGREQTPLEPLTAHALVKGFVLAGEGTDREWCPRRIRTCATASGRADPRADHVARELGISSALAGRRRQFGTH